MITSIYIGKDKLDLYEDDNITLKSSIAEVQDISKVFTDSTNSFSVPATDNNNRIFKHFYNANLLDGWDIFNKVDAVIEMYGSFYKQGKVKLNNVTLKSQKPTSYSIQFYGLLTSLKDIVTDDKLSDLDFSEYNYVIDQYNVDHLLTDAQTDIVNTTLSTKRMIYDSDSEVNNTDEIKNIALNNTGYESGLEWQYTSTSILNIRIIEKIEEHYGITFSRDFFGKSAFSNLYLLLNGSGTETTLEEQIVFDIQASDPTLYNNRVLLSTELPYEFTNYVRISIEVLGDNKTDEFTSVIKANDVEIHSVTANGNSLGYYSYLIKAVDYDTFENLTFHFSSTSFLNYKYTVDRNTFSIGAYTSERDFNYITGDFDVSSKMPDLKVIDYLKGIFQQNKLIAISTSNTDLYVETLENYYREGAVKNIDNYVDYDEVIISTGNIYNEINYKFKEPSTLLQLEFYENNSIYFGDLEYSILDVNGNKIDGESIDIELPFENMIYEKIADVSGNDDLNFMYGYMVDDSLSAVNVKAHMHYVERINTDSPIKVLTSSSTYTTSNYINVPSHTLGFNIPIYSQVFGEEFNEYNGVKITNTLYSNYHKNYIINAFSENKRRYNYKCKNLPIHFLLNLNLNDILEIKSNYYRINSYSLNLLTKECDFELYNIKQIDLTPVVSITADTTEYTTDTTLITADNNS